MTSIRILAGAVLALVSTISAAQLPPGITPEMINMQLPEESSPKAVPGPYAVTNELAAGNEAVRVFRPTDLGKLRRRDKLPVVIWGNGGCAINTGRHAGFVETIASHGFVVVTTNDPTAPPPGGRPRTATAADFTTDLDWAMAENQREGSPLKGKIDTKKVALMGQSCGGRLSLEVGGDPRVSTIVVMGAGMQNPDQFALLQKLHGPVLLLNGGEPDFMFKPSKATFDAIDKLPVFYGSRHGAGHSSTIYHRGGGEFANIASNWLKWQLKGDKKASKMFVGGKCGLCGNAEWDVGAKGLR